MASGSFTERGGRYGGRQTIQSLKENKYAYANIALVVCADATLQRRSQLPSAKVAALLTARCIFLLLTKRLHEKVTSISASVPFYGGDPERWRA